jgi:hypothetical protein
MSTDPYFRTLVTYEVLTTREAFNGDAEYLAAEVRDGTASAKLVLRAVETLLPASVVEKLAEHGQDPDFFEEAEPEYTPEQAEALQRILNGEDTPTREWIDPSVGGQWPRYVTQAHIDADNNHAASRSYDTDTDCAECGLAITRDGKRHGSDA